jgi:hypothetical protein
MYLGANQVALSFKRLASRQDGKSHLEKTSSLMYFLAFDAVCKARDTTRLDLNPSTMDGKNCRKEVELQFTKLVLLKSDREGICQVSELGRLDFTSTEPAKRISSNFFTVPLKKATMQVEPYFYPKRPNAPLLKLGQAATGVKWGIEYHDHWQLNFPKFLGEVTEHSPFTDLAIFVLRDQYFDEASANFTYIEAIKRKLGEYFSADLAAFWVKKIEREKVMIRHIKQLFFPTYTSSLSAIDTPQAARFAEHSRSQLLDYIAYLESVLDLNGIQITKI